jgi:hypothetical protein
MNQDIHHHGLDGFLLTLPLDTIQFWSNQPFSNLEVPLHIPSPAAGTRKRSFYANAVFKEGQ